jgi:hypothetical protein
MSVDAPPDPLSTALPPLVVARFRSTDGRAEVAGLPLNTVHRRTWIRRSEDVRRLHPAIRSSDTTGLGDGYAHRAG